MGGWVHSKDSCLCAVWCSQCHRVFFFFFLSGVQVPHTQESLREWDDTVVDKTDPELLADEAEDEFAGIFSGEKAPKVRCLGVWALFGRFCRGGAALCALFTMASTGLLSQIMVTTKPHPSGKIFHVLRELMILFPSVFYYKRGTHTLKKICKWAHNKNFSHLMVLGEKRKKPHRLLIVKLPFGPSTMFKLSSFTPIKVGLLCVVGAE